jgi:hypothetical protein
MEAKNKLQPLFKSMEGKLEWYCLDYWSEQLQLDIAGLKAEIAELISILMLSKKGFKQVCSIFRDRLSGCALVTK